MKNKTRMMNWLAGSLLLGAGLNTASAAELPKLVPASPAALQRWQDMRFGMFIHWGPVSITGHEIGWSRGAQTPIAVYDNLYKQFNPTNFNAAEWVQTARDAGFKYMVLTTKHHDGFCLWDTKQTDYNIMNSPFGRDVVKELADACKQAGMAFGTYHSVCDWHHPDFPLGSPGGSVPKPHPNMDRYTEYLRAQVTELIKNYGPLLYMWFDVPQQTGPDRGIPTANLVRSLQPDILINNRVGGTPADFDTPEQTVGGFNMDRPWETCMTICQQWSWKPNDNLKSLSQCLRTLIQTAGGNGNLLFNVGPMPDGRIEPRQVQRLKEMGAWLKNYGVTIYGTRGGPFKPGKWGASTRIGNRIFLHVFQWEKGNQDALELPAIAARVRSARRLDHKAPIQESLRQADTPLPLLQSVETDFQQNEEGLTVRMPPAFQDPIDTIVMLELDRPAIQLAPAKVGSSTSSLSSGAKAKASNVYQNMSEYDAGKAVDGETETRWATDGGTHEAWLELDLGKNVTFTRMAIREWAEGGNRIQRFNLQFKEGGEWKTIFAGTTMGPDFTKRFEAVTARVVRLNVLEATDGPTIDEWEILK